MSRARSSFMALLLATVLVSLGFVVGYGFQSGTKINPEPTPTPQAVTQAPLVKGLRLSPDGKWLAFTGVYEELSRAGVFLVSPTTGRWNFTQSPAGWQDYVAQWRSDSGSIVLEREKIPRPTAEGRAGIYEVPVDRVNGRTGELRDLTPSLPRGEKIVSSLLAPNGQLYLRTKREPKALMQVNNGVATPIDRAGTTLSQNRSIVENGRTIFLNVRDEPNGDGSMALYRVENKKATAISPRWQNVRWSYVSPAGKFVLLAREAGSDWEWSLYRIGRSSVSLIKTAIIPSDVIVVNWSPDEKKILGAAGEKMWLVDVPSLGAKAIGQRNDWHADDAIWLDTGRFAAVAANGELWRLDTQTGQANKFWRFPNEFWQ